VRRVMRGGKSRYKEYPGAPLPLPRPLIRTVARTAIFRDTNKRGTECLGFVGPRLSTRIVIS